ncbi:MAG: hypothetical protein GY909_02275 [Oligoflexia bacterium]|nr:hypothetical protein [Oligoflexia bacterium]
MAHTAKITKVFFLNDGIMYPLQKDVIKVRKEDAKKAKAIQKVDHKAEKKKSRKSKA